MDDDKLLSGDKADDEEASLEKSLRPQTLAQYIGQARVKHELGVYIEAARKREESLDHVLLYGPPGLGKTTLAMVIANEMQVNIRTTSGPAIEKPGDLVALLNELEPGDILFIDEIHRLPKIVEEMLYSAMEDFFVDIVVGQGPTAHPVHFPLPPFTLSTSLRVGFSISIFALSNRSISIYGVLLSFSGRSVGTPLKITDTKFPCSAVCIFSAVCTPDALSAATAACTASEDEPLSKPSISPSQRT